MSRALGDKEQAQLDTDKVPRTLACTCVLCGRGAMQRLHGEGCQGLPNRPSTLLSPCCPAPPLRFRLSIARIYRRCWVDTVWPCRDGVASLSLGLSLALSQPAVCLAPLFALGGWFPRFPATLTLPSLAAFVYGRKKSASKTRSTSARTRSWHRFPPC